MEGTVFTGVCLFTEGTPSQYGGTLTSDGVPLLLGWMGVLLHSTVRLGGVPNPPHQAGWGTPPGRQSRAVSTCYTVDSMPLAFMQEDFLVMLMRFFLVEGQSCYACLTE